MLELMPIGTRCTAKIKSPRSPTTALQDHTFGRGTQPNLPLECNHSNSSRMRPDWRSANALVFSEHAACERVERTATMDATIQSLTYRQSRFNKEEDR
jgi:hypothetical protein